MLPAIDLLEGSIHRTGSVEFWHVWTVMIPRRSIDGRFVRGRVWRRHDGRRWQYRAITEYDQDPE